ncbi:hypothetical protein AX774_g3485, partial [Zancudomyces culisetae]
MGEEIFGRLDFFQQMVLP